MSPCPADCDPRVTRWSWDPPHLEQICTVCTAASPKTPTPTTQTPAALEHPQDMVTEPPGCVPTPWSPRCHPSFVVCGKALMSCLFFAHFEQMQVPKPAKGHGHRARSRLGCGHRRMLQPGEQLEGLLWPQHRAPGQRRGPRAWGQVSSEPLGQRVPSGAQPRGGGRQTEVKWIDHQSRIAPQGHQPLHR